MFRLCVYRRSVQGGTTLTVDQRGSLKVEIHALHRRKRITIFFSYFCCPNNFIFTQNNLKPEKICF